MSTAKKIEAEGSAAEVPQKKSGTESSPAKGATEAMPQFTPSDFADILSTTLAMAAEAGLTVGVRNAEPTAARPAGLLVFIAGLTASTDGRLVATPEN